MQGMKGRISRYFRVKRHLQFVKNKKFKPHQNSFYKFTKVFSTKNVFSENKSRFHEIQPYTQSVEISRFFCSSEILCEINFRESRSSKSVVFLILEALNFVVLVNFSHQKVQKFTEMKILTL